MSWFGRKDQFGYQKLKNEESDFDKKESSPSSKTTSKPDDKQKLVDNKKDSTPATSGISKNSSK